MTFPIFFAAACGNERMPYPYQERLACEEPFPELLNVPTGLGKTAAAVLAWLWRRRFHSLENIRRATPRRLVYCLPMRVLVEQTFGETRKWLRNLGLLADTPQRDENDARASGWAGENRDKGHRIAVHLLMGGEDATDWALWPERDAILIGTQDMLLSRAINRGYAASRARWPIEFGLLNNDCLWVFDEVQLMGSALATSAQLDAFRNGGKQASGFGCIGNCRSLWMSATIQPDWLETVDHSQSASAPVGITPEESREANSEIGRRLHARKTLREAKYRLEKKPAALAEEILDAHIAANQAEERGLTLVVVNTVDRAMRLHDTIERLRKKRKLAIVPLLVHSRFRAKDRQAIVDALISEPPLQGRIVVSTQVVEAGVDISAKVMFTDLAPWASLVQRFGRCNRKGEFSEAEIYWIEVDQGEAAPYEQQELSAAREIIARKVSADGNVAPLALPKVELPYHPAHVLRRKDMVDLFDTTPDLAGNDIDISRFLRDGEDHDVEVFWRAIPANASPDENEAPARREELCPVGVGKFREFLVNHARVWRWDFLDNRWVKATRDMVFPGQTFLIASDEGGYSSERGWDDGEKAPTLPVEIEPMLKSERSERATGDDPWSEGRWQSIAEHTDDVCAELATILQELPDEISRNALNVAARWHDWGKAHSAFQAKLKPSALEAPAARRILDASGGFVAKAPASVWRSPGAKMAVDDGDMSRRYFRHELASALGMLQISTEFAPGELRDLIIYLIAAHHGKVRLSIRSLPGERAPPAANGEARRFARGVWEGDALPATDLGGGIQAPAVAGLSLEPMELGYSGSGAPSWATRMLAVRDEFGLFRMAFMESVLRAADWRASGKTDSQGGPSYV